MTACVKSLRSRKIFPAPVEIGQGRATYVRLANEAAFETTGEDHAIHDFDLRGRSRDGECPGRGDLPDECRLWRLYRSPEEIRRVAGRRPASPESGDHLG